MDTAEGLWPEAFETQQSGTASEVEGTGSPDTEADWRRTPALSELEGPTAPNSGAGQDLLPAPGELTRSERPADSDSTVDPRPRRTKKSRAGRRASGKLARAVEQLRASEDRMVATLAATERTLRSLEAHLVFEPAGYGSPAELEERMMRATPLLSALREPVGGSDTGVSVAAADPPKAHTPRALSAISRALQRLRTLEARIRQEAWSARRALEAVERDFVYEECGYSSFEDFLERALGPSPLLANAITLAGEEPPPVPEVSEAAAPRDSIVAAQDADARPSRAAGVPAALAPDPLSDTVAVVPVSLVQPPPAEPVVEAKPKTAARSKWAVRVGGTFLLAVAASGVGAAVGHLPVLAAPARERTEAPAPPSAAPSSSALAPAPKPAPVESAREATPYVVAPKVAAPSANDSVHFSTAVYSREILDKTRAGSARGVPSKPGRSSSPSSAPKEAENRPAPQDVTGEPVERVVPSRGSR